MKAISGKQMCRLLTKQGWTLVRIRGSHHRYERTGFIPITVPVHRNETLKTGLQRKIMRDARLSEADL
jgi:predicted RNA binding protein YcfA (HicA-like mRNA interferase family)